MVTVPVGLGAYQRNYAGEPEIRLLNRFLETNPTNQREKVALLTRPGTNSLGQCPGGANRGCFSKPGLFNSDLFVVFGSNLYRLTSTGLIIPITGTLANNGSFIYFTWMKGIGYEFMFVSDGVTLWYYTTRAIGTLTVAGSGGDNPPNNITGQIIDINGTYYSWASNVNPGSPPNGTSGAPYLALLGTGVPDGLGFTYDASSLSNMALLLNYGGVVGDNYSSTVPGASPDVTATATGTTLVLTAVADLAAGNAVTTSVYSGSDVSFGATTLTGGGNQALQAVTGMGDGEAPGALEQQSSYVLIAVGNTTKFYWLNPGTVVIDPLNFASKESNPDPITGMGTIGDQTIITGAGSTENWYATGQLAAPFAPIEGRVYRRGVIPGTEVVVKDSLMVVGDDGIVYTIGYNWGDTSQYGVHRTSNHGIEERIRTQMRIMQGLPA